MANELRGKHTRGTYLDILELALVLDLEKREPRGGLEQEKHVSRAETLDCLRSRARSNAKAEAPRFVSIDSDSSAADRTVLVKFLPASYVFQSAVLLYTNT